MLAYLIHCESFSFSPLAIHALKQKRLQKFLAQRAVYSFQLVDPDTIACLTQTGEFAGLSSCNPRLEGRNLLSIGARQPPKRKCKGTAQPKLSTLYIVFLFQVMCGCKSAHVPLVLCAPVQNAGPVSRMRLKRGTRDHHGGVVLAILETNLPNGYSIAFTGLQIMVAPASGSDLPPIRQQLVAHQLTRIQPSSSITPL